MSIPIRCEPCDADLKVPDRLAGKKAKCPRCGEVIPVPASSEAIMAASGDSRKQGNGAAPPGRSPKAAPPVRLPLLSFEELKVPGRLRRSIEEEVGDEET